MTELALKEKVFNEPDDYFSSLIHDIASAKKSIDLETFIFSCDDLGLRVAQHLANAAKRGVRVRLLVDGAGALFGGTYVERLLLDAGVKIRIYHPLPWRLWQWSHTTRFKKRWWFRRLFLFVFHVNSRNHRKVTLIDKKIVWVGSANIAEYHLSFEQGGKNWRDTALRLENSDFRDLQLAFDAEFTGRHYQRLFRQPVYNSSIRLNNTLQRRHRFHRSLLRKVQKAKEKIWITNAYFVPTEALLKQLCYAAWRGVDVKIILPKRNNHIFMGWAQLVFYERLLKAGVEIYEYIPSMLHAKTLIIDSWYVIGSTNLNHRSFFRDFEVDVVLASEDAKAQTEKQFLADKAESRKIYWSSFHMLGWFRRALGRLVLLGRYSL